MAEFDEQVTVRVWRMTKKLGVIPTGHLGHVALTLKGSRVSGGSIYISWWPKEGTGMRVMLKELEGYAAGGKDEDAANQLSGTTQQMLRTGQFTPRPGQYTFTYGGETWWGQQASAKIHLPGLGSSSACWGLSTARMAAWWKSNPLGHYQMASISRSCAGAAAQALHVGGAGAYASSPFSFLYMEPNQIEDWARSARKRLDSLNGGTAELRRQYDLARARRELGLTLGAHRMPGGLWRSRTWRKESSVRGGIRGPTIQTIGSLLGGYHATSSTNFAERLAILVRLMKAIVKHRREKPHSKRRLALLRLGKQVIDLVRSQQFITGPS